VEGSERAPKKRKPRKPRYPKGFDPADPGPPPDPERWLPKQERAVSFFPSSVVMSMSPAAFPMFSFSSRFETALRRLRLVLVSFGAFSVFWYALVCG